MMVRFALQRFNVITSSTQAMRDGNLLKRSGGSKIPLSSTSNKATLIGGFFSIVNLKYTIRVHVVNRFEKTIETDCRAGGYCFK